MSSMPTVLPARSSPGFEGLNSAISDMGNAYQKATLRKYMTDHRYDSYLRRSGSSSGKGIDPKAIARVIGGMEDPSDVLGKEGMAQAVSGVEATNPGMADTLDAGEPTTDAQGNPVDENVYSNTIRNKMLKEFAPGMTMDQVKRKAMGLPVETPEDKALTKEDLNSVPSDFKDNLKKSVESAGGDEDKLAANLKSLAFDYADNKPASITLNRLITQHKAKKVGYRK